MESHVTATEAARTFSDLLNRVRYRGETVIVDRGGIPVCRISPVAGTPRRTLAELARLLREGPRPDEGYWRSVEQATKRQPPARKSPWPR